MFVSWARTAHDKGFNISPWRNRESKTQMLFLPFCIRNLKHPNMWQRFFLSHHHFHAACCLHSIDDEEKREANCLLSVNSSQQAAMLTLLSSDGKNLIFHSLTSHDIWESNRSTAADISQRNVNSFSICSSVEKETTLLEWMTEHATVSCFDAAHSSC